MGAILVEIVVLSVIDKKPKTKSKAKLLRLVQNKRIKEKRKMTTDEELPKLHQEIGIKMNVDIIFRIDELANELEDFSEKYREFSNKVENVKEEFIIKIKDHIEKVKSEERQRVLEEVRTGIDKLKQSIKRWALTGNIDQDNIAREHVLIYISEFESFLNGGKK